jgi:hypothetical protein
MGDMCDGLLVEVRVDRSYREIVAESEIRICKEILLYEQLREVCIILLRLRCAL